MVVTLDGIRAMFHVRSVKYVHHKIFFKLLTHTIPDSE